MSKKAPCIDCTERRVEPNCHETCAKYKKWKALRKMAQRQAKEENLYYDPYDKGNKRNWMY